MQAIQIVRYGKPDSLQWREIPSLPLLSDTLKVRVKASGVNFADLLMRMGMYPEAPRLPFVPGYEVAGEVLEVGPLVTRFKPGDRVFAPLSFGGYASEAIVSEQVTRKIPSTLTEVQAAAIPVNFLTAWVALEEMARVRMGDRVLIQSAAGGVGLAATQMAAQRGAHVVGLVGHASKAETVQSYGAKEVWTYGQWQKARLKPNEKFQVILDSRGGEWLKLSFDSLAPMGRVVNFGVSQMVSGKKRSLIKVAGLFLKTPLFPPLKLMMHNKGVYGLNLLKLTQSPGLVAQCLDRLLDGFEDGRFKVLIGKTFSLRDAQKAHDYLQSGQSEGKVVLIADSNENT